MNQEIAAELEASHEALLEAEHLWERDLLRGAAARAYFAIFHAASAMLLAEGKKCESHKETIAAFGKLFAKSGRVNPKFHRYLVDAFDFREEADYVVQVPLKPGKVAEWVEKAREFVKMAEEFLKGSGGKHE